MPAPLDTEDQVLAVASAIADGAAVDWNEKAATDAETAGVLGALRSLEAVSRLTTALPDAWGPFRLVAELGHGAHGVVYRAFDAALQVDVALKVTRPSTATAIGGPERALNEARLLAKVNHPNVVRVYRAEQIGADIGVAMELVRGRTLSDVVDHDGPLSANEAMLVGTDVCRALAAVHGVGLVHGDVKAHNVMRATGGRTVLMDFGAGFDARTDQRAGRRFVGTPMYLAPEVFAGEPRTTVSDIYSLGVLLFHLATRTYPIEGRTGTEIGRRHETQAPRRLLRDVRADLPEAFIAVVERATAVRPSDRYQTAGEFEAALHHALRHGDATPPPGAAPRRMTPLTGALAGLAVIAIVGLGLALWRGATAPASSVTGPPSSVLATAPVDGSYSIEAAFFRTTESGQERLTPDARVARDDRLSLRVMSSVPMYVYVVNEDDQGESYLLYPLRGLPVANPLAPSQRHDIPGVVGGDELFWQVSSTGGREHFVIFASPMPLSPAFQRIFDALPAPVAGRTAPALPVTPELAGVLRGVGGLTKAPAARPGLAAEFGAPLADGAETVRGVWVRQLTVANPQ